MAIWIYITGVIAALISLALVVDHIDKRLTVGTLAKGLLCSLLSWITVLAVILTLLFYFVDWNKEIWRKKE